MQIDPNIAYNPRLLRRAAAGLDAVYFHWVDTLWRAQGSRLPWRTRAIPNLLQLGELRRELVRLRRNGTAILWTIHNLEPHERDTFVDQLGRRTLARMADLRVCHSQATRAQVLSRYGGSPERTVLMYLGNYADTLSGADDPVAAGGACRPAGKRTLLCFGNIRGYKGVDLALDAARILGDDYHLVVAGRPISEELERDLRDRASGLPNVRLDLRFLGDSEISPLMSAADCVLLPYRAITGSAALLAALTHGCGVVTSDLPYFREILEMEPDAGVMHEPGSADALARAISEFFSRSPSARGEAARRLSERFSWSHVIVPVAERIREIVSQRSGHRDREISA
ncbi:MAG TPA: glycosyltransferase family 4 protein [Longimicrobiaceae bacterium]|nr:glycosyltransferase family 4 protein [Longimicrobiaceae bacterium]